MSLFPHSAREVPYNPVRTVRADIRLDIRKITNFRVELAVQPRICVVNRAPISGYPLGYRYYEYQSAKLTVDIRGSTNNSTRTSVILRISKRISKRYNRVKHGPFNDSVKRLSKYNDASYRDDTIRFFRV